MANLIIWQGEAVCGGTFDDRFFDSHHNAQ